MVSTIYLIIVTFGVFIQNVFKKQYNEKTGSRGGSMFCALSAVFAALVFLFAAEFPLKIEPGVVGYSVGFAVVYAIALIFSVLAIANGSLAITSLILSYSLLIPTFYGIIFLKNEITDTLVIGLVLFMISLFLINYKAEKEEGQHKVTFKWIIYVILAFVGNGMCSTVTNMQVEKYNGAMKSEFMILAYIISMIFMFVYALFTERKDITLSLKKGWLLALLCGVFNGIVNLLVILLLERKELQSSVIFPTIAAGGMILTFIVSLTLYKEKMTKAQTVGFFIGVVSVILLNL